MEHLKELRQLAPSEMRDKLLAGDERNPPLFDWRLQLGFADEIIARVGAEKCNHSAIGRRSPRTDLSRFRDDVAKLLAALQETYIVARDDYEPRNDPKRPGLKLRTKDVVIVNGVEDSDIDFSEYDGDTDWDWERVYEDVYARPRGAPGRTTDRDIRADSKPRLRQPSRRTQPCQTAGGSGYWHRAIDAQSRSRIRHRGSTSCGMGNCSPQAGQQKS